MWRLQREDDPECRAFRRMVRGTETPVKGSMQGTYVFSPEGVLLARRNTNSAKAVKELIGKALAKWKAEPAPAKTSKLPAPRGRWEDNHPADGLVLLRTARDLPSSGDPTAEPAKRFNRDPVWFSRDEARRFVPGERKVGSRRQLPPSLGRRLARFVFVDNARGQTIPYAPSEVKEAGITTEITGLEGDLVHLKITGATRADAKGPWLLGENDWKPKHEWPHTMSTKLLGEATWNARTSRFMHFEALALGWRTGRTVMCARGKDASPGPIGFVLELAPATWKVPPTFIDMYDVPWVRHPDSPRPADENSFSVACWVRTRADGESFPALLTDKDWDGGEIRDFTSNHALGSSRTHGTLRGFALALQPDGSWTWNVGDGQRRLDYRPTAARQPVNDGRRHLLAFTIDRGRNEARLFHDGRNVAIYSLAGLGPVRLPEAETRQAEGVTGLALMDGVLDDATIAGMWEAETEQPVRDTRSRVPVKQVRVLAWNIWHGGRRDGNEIGLKKTVEVIKKSRADVVCMQETYGSGAAIADALGFHFYLRSSNLSVMSRWPIKETHDLFQPFRFGGATIEASPGQQFKAFSLWIHYLPDIGKAMKRQEITVKELLAAEMKTRGGEIHRILHTLEPHVRAADAIPLIVAGDFNSCSHLDWTQATAERHRGLVVPWPVSRQMERYGFTDAFRQVHPDPVKKPARTWSPRFTDDYPQRIDYVYFKGRGLEAKKAQMLDRHPKGWPSDHAAVLVTLKL